MRPAIILAAAVCAMFSVVDTTLGDMGQTVIAQTESRCGPRPMKPMSCLNGAWVCQCRGSGQVCNWELIGCQTTPGTSRPLGESNRPSLDPHRPGLLGR